MCTGNVTTKWNHHEGGLENIPTFSSTGRPGRKGQFLCKDSALPTLGIEPWVANVGSSPEPGTFIFLTRPIRSIASEQSHVTTLTMKILFKEAMSNSDVVITNRNVPKCRTDGEKADTKHQDGRVSEYSSVMYSHSCNLYASMSTVLLNIMFADDR